MDFESDPASEFLQREREELGDLENEIISSNGEWNISLSKLSFVLLWSGFFTLVEPEAVSGEPLSSDDFEMINNDLAADGGAENDGKCDKINSAPIND